MKVCILKSINRPNQNHHGYDYSIIAGGGGGWKRKEGRGNSRGKGIIFKTTLVGMI